MICLSSYRRPTGGRIEGQLLIAIAALMQGVAVARADELTWRRVLIDATFRSEAVATADVNRDGKIDVLVGDLWYAAPDFEPHEIRKPGVYQFDGGYSKAFAIWAYDVNADGWKDQIVVGFPGEPCHWYENPRHQAGHWREHGMWHEASNESPWFVDLSGDSRPEFVLGSDSTLGFLRLRAAPEAPKTWSFQAVSEKGDSAKNGSARFYHGLGVGDVNGDGRKDVVIPHGWYEAPSESSTVPWTFHPIEVTPVGTESPLKAAHIYVQDLDLDGDSDLLLSSAHNYGVWWLENQGSDRFHLHSIDRGYSQSHALWFIDINGDGQEDLVTGKRFFAHNGHDPGGKEPVVLYWYEIQRRKGQPPEFTPHEIVAGRNTGIGTQFEVRDVNGDQRPDVITSNKKGVNLLLQVP